MSSETGAPVNTWTTIEPDDAPSVRSILVRFTVASSAALALVALAATRVDAELAPVAIVVLTVLLVVQIPFVWKMAATLRASERERDRLQHQVAATNQSLRRQIATDLHDSIAQDLSGVSFSLAALGRNESIDPAAVAEAAQSLRTTLGSFRFVLDETLLDR